jgi:hypothetical protein
LISEAVFGKWSQQYLSETGYWRGQCQVWQENDLSASHRVTPFAPQHFWKEKRRSKIHSTLRHFGLSERVRLGFWVWVLEALSECTLKLQVLQLSRVVGCRVSIVKAMLLFFFLHILLKLVFINRKLNQTQW